jgi:hypothetical protein
MIVTSLTLKSTPGLCAQITFPVLEDASYCGNSGLTDEGNRTVIREIAAADAPRSIPRFFKRIATITNSSLTIAFLAYHH